jgi:hypothetical protein
LENSFSTVTGCEFAEIRYIRTPYPERIWRSQAALFSILSLGLLQNWIIRGTRNLYNPDGMKCPLSGFIDGESDKR